MKILKNNWPLLVLFDLLIIVLIIYIATFKRRLDREVNTSTPTTVFITPAPQISTTQTSPGVPTESDGSSIQLVSDGETWLAKPEVMDDLELIKTKDGSKFTGVRYFRVGVDHGKDIIMFIIPCEGPCLSAGDFARFIKNGEKSYELLTLVSDNFENDFDLGGLASIVAKNDTKKYRVLEYRPNLNVNGVVFTAQTKVADWFQDIVDRANNKETKYSISEYSVSQYGKIYSESSEKDGYKINSFFLLRPDFTTISYQLKPKFVGDDMIPQIIWDNDSKNKDTYRFDGFTTCGSPYGLAVLGQSGLDGLKKAGLTNNGEVVYDFTSKNNPIVKKFYEDYAYTYDGDKKVMRGDAISIDEYLKRHGVFVYKDALERLVLFSSTVYGIQAECGKPVIYLYPQQPTHVTVKVAASISVSEPEYKNGWDVLAMPNGGLITTSGRLYNSLFWEGLGMGIYPIIHSGFVIEQTQLEQALRHHLYQLGLNKNESDDFLDFWLPKMPQTPYVRLTWLGTHDMDRLAPLTISPKPDTFIRIFLDFEGLQKPISLKPQRLVSTSRHGFTIVEWGGLLKK